MATYANPYAKGRPIKTRGSTIANGIARMAKQFGQDQKARKAKEQRDIDEAEALLTGRSLAAERSYLKGYNALEADFDKFSEGLSEENRNVFQDEIKKLLIAGRDDLSNWIKENPDAGRVEIELKLKESLEDLQKFRMDLVHLNAARQEWDAAKDLKPGEEGSIVGNFNPELIKLFEAQERNDPNVNLTFDDDGSLRFSLVNEQDLNNALSTAGDNDIIEFTTVNLTDLNKQAAAGNGFFRKIEKPDFSDLREQIKQEIINGNTEFGTAKDGEIVSINEEVITDYINGTGKYENQPNGRGVFSTYIDEEDQYGNWLYYGDDVEVQVPDGKGGEIITTARTNQLNNFDQNKLRDYMVTDFIDSFGNIKRNTTMPSSPVINPSTPPPTKDGLSKPPKKDSLGLGIDTKTNNNNAEEEIKEEEIIDLKNPMGISFDDFDTIKDEDSVIKLLKKFSDDFDFGSTTSGKDEIYIKSKQDPSIIKTFDLNTEYNKNEGKVPLKPMYGKFVYESINKFIRENLPKK